MSRALIEFVLDVIADAVVEKVDAVYNKERNKRYLSSIAYNKYNIMVLIDYEHEKLRITFSDVQEEIYYGNQIDLRPFHFCLDELREEIIYRYNYDLSIGLQ